LVLFGKTIMPLKNLADRKQYARAQYLKNKAKYLAASKSRRLRLQAEKALLPKPERVLLPCNTCGAERNAAIFPMRGNQCKPCISLFQKIYRKNNAERIAASKKQWATENAEYKAQQAKAYAQANPEARKLARDKWDQQNPGALAAAKAKNARDRIKRVPKWLTEDDHWMMEQAYELAQLRTKMFGFKWHVDHIIPLNGKKVSGLHVPTNLQVIPAIVNLRKGSRWASG